MLMQYLEYTRHSIDLVNSYKREKLKLHAGDSSVKVILIINIFICLNFNYKIILYTTF